MPSPTATVPENVLFTAEGVLTMNVPPVTASDALPPSALSPVMVLMFITRNMYATNRPIPPTVIKSSRCFHSVESRIRNAEMYRQTRNGRYMPVRSLDDFQESRWYMELNEYGGLEYYLTLDYVARRGVRLVRPAAEE